LTGFEKFEGKIDGFIVEGWSRLFPLSDTRSVACDFGLAATAHGPKDWLRLTAVGTINDLVCAFSVKNSLQRSSVPGPRRTPVRYIQRSTVRPVNSAGPRAATTTHAREESQLRASLFQLAKKCYNSRTKNQIKF
jgi:hypothetical protein